MVPDDRRVRRQIAIVALLTALVFSSSACGSGEREEPRASESATAGASTERGLDPARVPRPRIVVLGDSLTAGLGLSPEEAYPALLQSRVDAVRLGFEVVNAGVSGDTSAGGLRRLDWSLDGDVRILIVALGGNDALRGLPVTELKANLEAIVTQAQSRKIDVVLAGMEAPPNFGKQYTDDFRGVYRSVAAGHHVALVPFLLEGVAGMAAMNQADGIHPTAEGARVAADNVWKVLEPIARARTER